MFKRGFKPDKDADKVMERTLLDRAKDGETETRTMNELTAARKLGEAGKIKILKDENNKITYQLPDKA